MGGLCEICREDDPVVRAIIAERDKIRWQIRLLEERVKGLEAGIRAFEELCDEGDPS